MPHTCHVKQWPTPPSVFGRTRVTGGGGIQQHLKLAQLHNGGSGKGIGQIEVTQEAGTEHSGYRSTWQVRGHNYYTCTCTHDPHGFVIPVSFSRYLVNQTP